MSEDKSNFEEESFTLFVPVGIGYGDNQDSNKDLAETLVFLITEQNPDNIVFFTTDLSSKYTLNYIKKIYKNKEGHKLKNYTTIRIKNIDDFDEIYKKINKQIEKHKGKIKIDYTSGTKTMTMAACIAATVNQCELIFISGERNENSIIEESSRFVKKQNLNEVFKSALFNEIKDLFNHYRFNQGLERLESVHVEDDDNSKFLKMGYELLFVTYKHFDDFNHKEALEKFSTGFYIDFPDLKNQLKRNYKSLQILNDPNHERHNYYLIGSLMNNAYRRAEEGKYDDAIARLYRSIELLSQIGLEKYDIDPYNVDLDRIEADSPLIANYLKPKLTKGYDDKYKFISLDARFVLLYNISKFNEIAVEYFNNRNMYNNMLHSRNNSIIAHGTDVKTFEDYENFKNSVLVLFKLLTEDYKQILDATSFPQFK